MNIKRFLILIVFLIICAPCLAGEVKFAQLSDVHVTTKPGNAGGRMLEQSSMMLNDAVSQINNIKDVDFVIFTGDLINEPNKNYLMEFKKSSDKFNMPWYWTFGNHDVGPTLNKKAYLAELNNINPIKHNKSYYSFVKGDFLFICMDGTFDIMPTPHAQFSKAELEWLDTQLEQNQDKYAVIFQHFPLVEPFKSGDHYILNADKYFEVIDRHKNLIAVITGHYHAAKITKRNNVLHISSPSMIQYPNSFRVITIKTTEEGVKLNIELKPTGLKSVRNTSFLQTKSNKLNEGSKEDRNATITLPVKLN